MSNVLITALSLYAPQSKEYLYVYRKDDEEYIVSGAQTNEPVPKALGLYLEDKKETLDKIIVLCTPAALKPINGNAPSLERYRHAMSSHFGVNEKELFECVFLSDNPDSEQIFTASLEVAAILKSLENVSVYVDSTGGFRDAMMSMISTMQLLKDSGIAVKDVFYTIFDRDRREPYEIVSRKETYSVYELVSGMDELKKYGNVSRLAGVLSERGVTPTQQKILDALHNVYTEMQLCRVEQSKNALLKLSALLIKYTPDGSVFDKVVETSKLKYEGISEGFAYKDYIKWYFDHGYIAQTLAFFYETLPDILSENRILWAREDLIFQYEHRLKSLVNRRGWNYYFLNTYFKEEHDPEKKLIADAKNQVAALAEDEPKNLTSVTASIKEAVEFAVLLKKNEATRSKAPKSYENLLKALETANVNGFNCEADLLSKHSEKKIYNSIKANPAILSLLFSIEPQSAGDSPEELANLIVSSIDGVDSFVNPKVDIKTLEALLADYFYLKDQRNSVLHVETRSASPEVLSKRIATAIDRLNTVISQSK